MYKMSYFCQPRDVYDDRKWFVGGDVILEEPPECMHCDSWIESCTDCGSNEDSSAISKLNLQCDISTFNIKTLMETTDISSKSSINLADLLLDAEKPSVDDIRHSCKQFTEKTAQITDNMKGKQCLNLGNPKDNVLSECSISSEKNDVEANKGLLDLESLKVSSKSQSTQGCCKTPSITGSIMEQLENNYISSIFKSCLGDNTKFNKRAEILIDSATERVNYAMCQTSSHALDGLNKFTQCDENIPKLMSVSSDTNGMFLKNENNYKHKLSKNSSVQCKQLYLKNTSTKPRYYERKKASHHLLELKRSLSKNYDFNWYQPLLLLIFVMICSLYNLASN